MVGYWEAVTNVLNEVIKPRMSTFWLLKNLVSNKEIWLDEKKKTKLHSVKSNAIRVSNSILRWFLFPPDLYSSVRSKSINCPNLFYAALSLGYQNKYSVLFHSRRS